MSRELTVAKLYAIYPNPACTPAVAVPDGVNGRLAPPGDPAALAEAIMALLHNPVLARVMGRAGQARVAEYSAEKMVGKIAQLYEKLLSGIGNGRHV